MMGADGSWLIEVWDPTVKYWETFAEGGYMARDYLLFSLLNGVRDRAPVVVLVRGLPDDLEPETRANIEEQFPYRPTWLTPDEADQVRVAYETYSDSRSAQWCAVVAALHVLHARDRGAEDQRGGLVMGLGVPEIVIIVVVVLVLFGPSQLPKIGKSLGEGIKEFRKIGKELDE